MKNYLYVYSDNTHGQNSKEVTHSTANLKNKTIYKEAEGRNVLTIYKIDFETDDRKFIACYGI